MAKNAHEKSGFKPRKLPKCSKCNIEFVLVTACYTSENKKNKIVDEWECPKCHKIVAKDSLNEQEPSAWELFLHKKAIEINNESKRARDCKRSN